MEHLKSKLNRLILQQTMRVPGIHEMISEDDYKNVLSSLSSKYCGIMFNKVCFTLKKKVCLNVFISCHLRYCEHKPKLLKRKRKIKMENQIPFSDFTGKRKKKMENQISFLQCLRKTENENRKSNSVFRLHRKTENENGESNFVFRCHRKTENENRSLNSIFQCCRKTENKYGNCFSFFHAIEKRLALRYTHSNELPVK